MISSAALAVYLMELLKQFLAWATKNPGFEFTPKVMAALLVIANAVAVLILATLGVDGYQLPTDWVSWTKTLLVAVLGALVSSALYVVGYVPFKQFYHSFYAALAIKKAEAKSKAKKAK
jgi:protein-S-isoprenylcysteine O-methyltransferase Ste14